MSNLDKLNKQAEKDQERIDRLNAKMAEAEAFIMQDPDNSKGALEAATASMQAQAAQRALENTNREIQAEKGRVYEEEVKAARNELAEIEKKAAAIKDQEFSKAREFYKHYDAWLALAKQHEDLARKYSISVSNMARIDEGQQGITTLKWAIDQFTAAQQSLEVQRQLTRALAQEKR